MAVKRRHNRHTGWSRERKGKVISSEEEDLTGFLSLEVQL